MPLGPRTPFLTSIGVIDTRERWTSEEGHDMHRQTIRIRTGPRISAEIIQRLKYAINPENWQSRRFPTHHKVQRDEDTDRAAKEPSKWRQKMGLGGRVEPPCLWNLSNYAVHTQYPRPELAKIPLGIWKQTGEERPIYRRMTYRCCWMTGIRAELTVEERSNSTEDNVTELRSTLGKQIGDLYAAMEIMINACKKWKCIIRERPQWFAGPVQKNTRPPTIGDDLHSLVNGEGPFLKRWPCSLDSYWKVSACGSGNQSTRYLTTSYLLASTTEERSKRRHQYHRHFQILTVILRLAGPTDRSSTNATTKQDKDNCRTFSDVPSLSQ